MLPRNLLLLGRYIGEKPARLVNLARNRTISRTFISKSEPLKLAYIVNPKVASSSISLLLGGNIDAGSLKGKSTKQKHALLLKQPLNSYSEIDLLRDSGYFVFSFVRNPYTRIVSFYKNKFDQTDNGYLQAKKFAINRQFRKLKDFSDVVRVICNTPDYLSDAHFMSQTHILFGPDGLNRLDFIGKLENMDHDFTIIANRASLGEVGRTNASLSANAEWMDFYTLELANIVYERFKTDFNQLGYEDEHRKLIEHLQRPSS